MGVGVVYVGGRRGWRGWRGRLNAIYYFYHRAFPLHITLSLGCNTEMVDDIVWPESDIGQVVQLSCPCEGVFYSGQNTSRACVGNSSQGGQWMAVNYSQCDLVTSEMTILLCSIALVCNNIT